MDSKTVEKLLIYGGLAFLAYLLYKKFTGTVSAALSPANPVATSIGQKLQSILSPGAANYTPGSTYVVVFPDGTSHAIDPSTVAADGSFSYNGVTYMLATGVAGHAAYIPAGTPDTSAGYVADMTSALASG